MHPFHIMAAGYSVELERNVIKLFEDYFMKLSIYERNLVDDDGMTVLEILYKTRPLNRSLLSILNRFKHSDRVFLQ